MNVILNTEQEKAKDLIVEWYNHGNKSEKQCFVLTGYAGTGKTFLITYIVHEILKLSENEVAYLAPTGKAACVLIQKGALNACTIHKLIYNRVEVISQEKIEGKIIKTKGYKFVKKPSIKNYKLIILDETSMVTKDIMNDLLSFNIPVICCGDLGQLPPIGRANDILKNPDINLTQIVRQEEGNSIIKLAEMARKGIPIQPGNYGNVIVARKELIPEASLKKALLSADQILSGKNKTSNRVNHQMKKWLGYDNTKLNVGEKVICLLNNWSEYVDSEEKYSLVNGVMGIVQDTKVLNEEEHLGVLSFKADFTDDVCESLIYDNNVFETDEFLYDFHDHVCLTDSGEYQIKKNIEKREGEDEATFKKRLRDFILQKKDAIYDEQLNFFNTAYCISVHKSQGSEWKKVVLFDEKDSFPEPEKWLYTGITRAKEKLLILI